MNAHELTRFLENKHGHLPATPRHQVPRCWCGLCHCAKCQKERADAHLRK